MIDFLERLLAAQRRAEDGEKEPLLLPADPAWAAPAEEEKTGGAGRPEAGGETEEGAQAAERCGHGKRQQDGHPTPGRGWKNRCGGARRRPEASAQGRAGSR